MKVIDLYLAIERNKNIPKEVVYKYKTYRYYPEYKQYYREEYGDMISLSLEANCGDKVYLIEDSPKEDKNIKKLNTNYQYSFTEQLEKETIYIICKKINEIIERLNGE